ncbi:MAG: hypothetical protein K1X89_08475 [Myxococcaceae bacterium]|nr:hypothetical protein [Myxococcaceae bacterium]
MKRIVLFAVLAAACGGKPVAPELLTRDLPAPTAPDPVKAGERYPSAPQVPSGTIADAGCCPVVFALAARSPFEDSAALVATTRRFEMARADGGPWQVTACMPMQSALYWYEVGYLAADDAGVLVERRINEAAPIDTGSPQALEFNRFTFPDDGGTCSALDAAPYAQLPDAGS